ncbi:MAG: hypothetical protein SF182_01570 [Deltaproteobacteria bacterium]|nr:hypothetical protein [Deltaproteobacteria bacterium]
MGAHLIDGQFQSDKYPTCPRGKVPLSVKDPVAQPHLWRYAQDWRRVDAEFSDDLETALKAAGYAPPAAASGERVAADLLTRARRALSTIRQAEDPDSRISDEEVADAQCVLADAFNALDDHLTHDRAMALPRDWIRLEQQPIPMLLFCPRCAAQHVDVPQPEKDWENPPHRSHECQACSYVWRPADVATTGVASIATRGSRDGVAHPALALSEVALIAAAVRAERALNNRDELAALVCGHLVRFWENPVGPSLFICQWCKASARRAEDLVHETHCRAARALLGAACSLLDAGYVIGNSDRTRWRTLDGHGFARWTDDLDAALHFARRRDAEAFAAEDEDAWCILTVGEAAAGASAPKLAASTEGFLG